MCLRVDGNKTQEVIKNKRKTLRVYKIVMYNKKKDCLVSYYKPSYMWQPGMNVASRCRKTICLKSGKEVSYGIHAYQDSLGLRPGCGIIIPLTGLREDVRGVGCRDIVFTKLHLSKKVYKIALAEGRRRTKRG